MSQPLPEIRVLACGLLNGEKPHAGGGSDIDAAERVLQRLAERISPLVGGGGFVLLLQRALRRSRVEHPALAAVTLEQETPWRLPGLAEAARDAPEEARLAGEALVTELIGLLARFLGADMVTRLVRQSFPEVTRSGDTGAGTEENIHE